MTPPKLAFKLQSLPSMIHIYTPDPMSNCSKAPRGLFVLLRTDGIFTVNALSPSPSLRQCPHDYSIRAGQNFIYIVNYPFPNRSDYIFISPKSLGVLRGYICVYQIHSLDNSVE